MKINFEAILSAAGESNWAEREYREAMKHRTKFSAEALHDRFFWAEKHNAVVGALAWATGIPCEVMAQAARIYDRYAAKTGRCLNAEELILGLWKNTDKYLGR